jgi:hypothetical protein
MPDSLDRRHFVAGGLTLIGGLIGSGCGGGGGGGGTTSVDPGLTEPIGTATLSPDVVYFPETTPVTFRTTGDNIVEVTGPTPGLAVGKLLLITTGNGFAGRITSVETTAAGSRCQFESVTLDDIFEEADFSYSGEIPADAITFLEPDPTGTILTRAYSSPTRLSPKTRLKGSCGFKWKMGPQSASLSNTCEVSIGLDLSFRKNQTTKEVSFRFCPSVSAVGTMTFTLDSLDDGKIDKVELAKLTKRWRRFTAVVTTPVPLPFPLNILRMKWLIVGEISSSANLIADVKCKLDTDWNATVKCGAQYSSSAGWNMVKDYSGEVKQPKVPQMHGAFKADVTALEFSYSAFALGLGGPKVSLKALAGTIEAEYAFPNFEERGKATWNIEANSSIAGGIGFRSWLSKYVDDAIIEGSLLWYQKKLEIADTGVINGTIN